MVLKIFALSWNYLLCPKIWALYPENMHFILLQMSLFNRKVLQIGVVANLTLLQKYCILNIGNRLGKSGQCVVNVLRRDWLQRASSSSQFVSKYYNIRKFYAFSYECSYNNQHSIVGLIMLLRIIHYRNIIRNEHCGSLK